MPIDWGVAAEDDAYMLLDDDESEAQDLCCRVFGEGKGSISSYDNYLVLRLTNRFCIT